MPKMPKIENHSPQGVLRKSQSGYSIIDRRFIAGDMWGVLRKSQSGYSIIDRRFIAGDMDENRSPIGTNEERI